MNEQSILESYGQCVWLLTSNFGFGDSDDDFLPHTIYASQDELLKHNPGIEWSLIDSDAMKGRWHDTQYYATPWPVLGAKNA